METLERAEQKILCLAIQDAVRLAAEGEISSGYRCLMAGLDRAKEYASTGEPWAEGIAGEYERAIRCFEEMVHDAPSTLRYAEHQRRQFSGDRGPGMRAHRH